MASARGRIAGSKRIVVGSCAGVGPSAISETSERLTGSTSDTESDSGFTTHKALSSELSAIEDDTSGVTGFAGPPPHPASTKHATQENETRNNISSPPLDHDLGCQRRGQLHARYFHYAVVVTIAGILGMRQLTGQRALSHLQPGAGAFLRILDLVVLID